MSHSWLKHCREACFSGGRFVPRIWLLAELPKPNKQPEKSKYMEGMEKPEGTFPAGKHRSISASGSEENLDLSQERPKMTQPPAGKCNSQSLPLPNSCSICCSPQLTFKRAIFQHEETVERLSAERLKIKTPNPFRKINT